MIRRRMLITKIIPTITAPSATTYTYNGSARALVSGGSTDFGVLQYATASTGTYSTTIPTAVNAGSYTVWYKVVGDDRIETVGPFSVSCSIAQAPMQYTVPSAVTGLVYNGSSRALFSGGSATGGSIYYANNSSGTGATTTVPSGTNAGSYDYWWAATPDDNHSGGTTIGTHIQGNIAQKTINPCTLPTPVTNAVWSNTTVQLFTGGSVQTGGHIWYTLPTGGTGSEPIPSPSSSTTVPSTTGSGSFNYMVKIAPDNSNYSGGTDWTLMTAFIDKYTPTAPTAVTGLTYNHNAQTLVTGASTNFGTIVYCLGNSGGTYSTTAPTATDAGSYDVWWKLSGTTAITNNCYNTSPTKITVSIAKKYRGVYWANSMGATATTVNIARNSYIVMPQLEFSEGSDDYTVMHDSSVPVFGAMAGQLFELGNTYYIGEYTNADNGQPMNLEVRGNNYNTQKLELTIIPNGSYNDSYLTFTVPGAQRTAYFKLQNKASDIEYSTNYGLSWQTYSTSNVSVVYWGKVLWRGSGLTTSSGVGTFSASTNYSVNGNAMSMLNGSDFATAKTIVQSYALANLFSGDTHLTSSEYMVLPATGLTYACYNNMFRDCTSMTKFLENLPATKLAFGCYTSMFKGCSAATNGMATFKLSATTVDAFSCSSMFEGCSKISTAIRAYMTLPATTLSFASYHSMFKGCTSMRSTPKMTINSVNYQSCVSMFEGCTALERVDNCKLNAQDVTQASYESMFKGCTSLTTAPVLAARSVPEGSGAYEAMFSGCTNLNYIKAMFLNEPSTGFCENWVAGVAASGTFVKNYNATWDNTYGPSAIPVGWGVTTAEEQYLTLNILTAGKVKFIPSNTTYYTIEYSTDSGSTWTTANSSTEISVAVNNKVMFRGSFSDDEESEWGQVGKFSGDSTVTYNVEGNVMSLLYGDDFLGQRDLRGKSQIFSNLFKQNSGLINADTLVLPATNLSNECYSHMFHGCSLLEYPPQLPATTLVYDCYSNMFRECTSLIEAPELPAMALGPYCYESMFAGCTSLIEAPELPATYLPFMQGSYESMFFGCSSLNYIKAMFLNAPNGYETSNWVAGVAASGTFVKNPNAEWENTYGPSAIPTGWDVQWSRNEYFTTVVEYVPNASGTYSITFTGSSTANTLSYSKNGASWSTASSAITVSVKNGDEIRWRGSGMTPVSGSGINGIGCFGSTDNITYSVRGNIMSLHYGDNFSGQTAISSGKNNAFHSLFSGSTKLISAELLSLPATTFNSSQNVYNAMFSGCTSLTTAPQLPATTLSNGCYRNMFRGCTSLTKAPKLQNAINSLCYDSMFRGCTSLIEAPELPATTLANYCYRFMFVSCKSLTTAPELPATTLKTSVYTGMFADCTSLTKAPELPATTLTSECYNYMFSGCTKLNYIKASFTTAPSTAYTENWVAGVAASGTFVKNVNATWTNTFGASAIPTNWYVKGDASSYLTFEVTKAGTIAFSGSSTANTLSYSKNGGSWTTASSNFSINVNVGDKIRLKGTDMTPEENKGIGKFSSTDAKFVAYGNIMSLYYGDDFVQERSLSGKDNAFYYLFNNNSGLTNAEDVLLLATTLSTSCYYGMFRACKYLVKGPQLPAATLSSKCYTRMFNNCSNITEAPALNSTSLSEYCYAFMFAGCKSLTTAPELPATTLANYCYRTMFYHCSSLTTVSNLPNITTAYLPTGSLYCMFARCTSLRVAPSLPSNITGLRTNSCQGMFSGCTSLTTAPEIPATSIGSTYSGSCEAMFAGCTSLVTAPTLRVTTLRANCYQNMFSGCTNLNSITCLATNISATDCTSGWVTGVASSGNFYRPASMSSTWTTGDNGIPTGWTARDTS